MGVVNFKWDEKSTQKVLSMRAMNYTGPEIIAAMGVNRNSYYSLVRRLGIGKGKYVGCEKPPSDRVKIKPPPKFKAEPIKPRVIPDLPPYTPGEPIALEKTVRAECRYPILDAIDDAPLMVCGQHTCGEKSSYCEYHHKIAYIPYRRKMP